MPSTKGVLLSTLINEYIKLSFLAGVRSNRHIYVRRIADRNKTETMCEQKTNTKTTTYLITKHNKKNHPPYTKKSEST